MKIKMTKTDRKSINTAEIKVKEAGRYLGGAALTGVGVGVFLGCAEITVNMITGLVDKLGGKKFPAQKGGEQNA